MKDTKSKTSVHYSKLRLGKQCYCDYCAIIKATIQEEQTSINRRLRSGSADERALENKLQEHKTIARESLQSYKDMKSKSAEHWKEIITLESKQERTSVEDEQLLQLKHCFTLVLSADYQMQKLIPY